MRVIQIAMTGAAIQVAPNNPQNPGQTPYASLLVIQAPTGQPVTVGDNTVTATRGIVIAAGATLTLQFSQARGSALSQYWLVGASGNVEILYETAG